MYKRVSTSVSDLPEVGPAWLVDEAGHVRHFFFNGCFSSEGRCYAGDQEQTLFLHEKHSIAKCDDNVQTEAA